MSSEHGVYGFVKLVFGSQEASSRVTAAAEPEPEPAEPSSAPGMTRFDHAPVQHAFFITPGPSTAGSSTTFRIGNRAASTAVTDIFHCTEGAGSPSRKRDFPAALALALVSSSFSAAAKCFPRSVQPFCNFTVHDRWEQLVGPEPASGLVAHPDENTCCYPESKYQGWDDHVVSNVPKAQFGESSIVLPYAMTKFSNDTEEHRAIFVELALPAA